MDDLVAEDVAISIKGKNLKQASSISKGLIKKIVNFEDIESVIEQFRSHKKIVQSHGVFDLLHIGHIKHLNHAKSLGDLLVVSITADKFVNKGPGRPHFGEQFRAEALAALSCVDFVVVNYHPTAVEAIQQIKPHYYVKGVEYQDGKSDITGKIYDEQHAVEQHGGQIKFTDDLVFSSSALLNRYFSPFSKNVISYLDQLKSKYYVQDILSYLNSAKNINVLLIGEAIIDIYHYGEAIGKSGKEPVLVTKYHREESYVGGVLAVANHLSSFCAKVTCLTMLGEEGNYESFIRENMKENVDLKFIYKKDSPTIVKRRYLEEYTSQKLFEIYEIDDCYLEDSQRKDFASEIKKYIKSHDMVIVTDYGHGLLDQETIFEIEDNAKFLAVNAQSNAGNHGFNCISKYRKANYVCIATRELQLNYRQKHISVLEQMNQLIKDYNYENAVITNGRAGSYAYKKDEGMFEVPAFTSSIKDRVGAGDAVLAVTSLCAAQNAPAEIVGFIGNVVGSEAVNIMGNQSFIEKIPLMKHISHLMK